MGVFSAVLRVGLLIVAVSCFAMPHYGRADGLPPELVSLFEQLGITVDENGAPVTPPPPIDPPQVSTPEEIDDFFAQIGITIGEDGLPVAPEPPFEPSPVSTPMTPEELAELLGLPVEIFLAPPIPTPTSEPIAPVDPPEPPSEEPLTNQELADLLGLPLEVLFPATIAASAEPATTEAPSSLEEQLGPELSGLLGLTTSEATVATNVPEPTAFAALAIGCWLAAATRRRSLAAVCAD